MDLPQVQVLVERYQKQIKRLESQKDKLKTSERKRYEQLRDRFIAQIRSWQKSSEREFQQLESNLQESYNELESVWYTAQQR